MERFFLTTESTADLPAARFAALNVPVARVYCSVSGGAAGEDGPDGSLAGAILAGMRAGGRASTALVGTARYTAFFKPLLATGCDVLHLAVSSGLSGSCDCARLAACALAEAFPQRRVLVVDTLAVSGGQGLLLERTAAQKNRGYSLLACRDYADEQRASIQHLITAESPSALAQSGRLTSALPAPCGQLPVKPVLELDARGRLVLRERPGGRLSSMRALKKRFLRAYDERLNQTVRLVHADCPQDAKKLAGMLLGELPALEIDILPAGAAACAHIGPGGLGLFFRGHGRY